MLRKIDNNLHLLAETAYSFLRILIGMSFYRLKVSSNSRKNCIILGNGPSLKKTLQFMSDRPLKETDIYCVNFFANDPVYQKLKPTHYVLTDQSFWIDNTTEEITHKKKLLYDTLFSKTTWKLNLFLPIEARPYIAKYKSEYVNTVYYNRTPIVGFKFFRHVCYKYNLGMPTPQNVLIAAIYIAMHHKYKTIYMSGADHSWHNSLHVGEDNILYISDCHFYGEAKPVPFFKVGQREPYRMHEIFTLWAKVFRSYHLLGEYAKTNNSNIINISETSYVDAFQRNTMEHAFSVLQ